MPLRARHYRTFEETECPGIAATASIVFHNTISSKTHLSLVVQQLPTPRCEARQAAESSGNLEVISLSAVILHRNPCKVRREVDVAGWCHSRSWARSWGPESWNSTAVGRYASNRYYQLARSEIVAKTLSGDCHERLWLLSKDLREVNKIRQSKPDVPSFEECLHSKRRDGSKKGVYEQ